MKRFYGVIIALVMVLSIGWYAGAEKAIEKGALSSTAGDRTGMAVTVYNMNLALVKDRRDIMLDRGTRELKFMDVASGIIPQSVNIASLNGNDLRVLEQNYEYDLLDPDKLLDKYVGKEVKLLTANPYKGKEKIETATLLSNNGGPIFRIGDEITYGHPGRVIFPGVPENLISKPTLVWLVDTGTKGTRSVEASYLTGGINWRSDYVVTLNDSDDRADLTGWVTIDNQSGATYTDARLKLVAGDVNTVEEEYEFKEKLMDGFANRAAEKPQFQEDAFFEYHIYTLQRPSTIKNNQTKQINLIKADTIPVKKEFIYYGAPYYYQNRYSGAMNDQKVGVYVEIANREDNNLGIPLPKGTMRVYKHDSEGSLQFIGENRIDHTPKDEKIKIKLGDAFDIVGERKQTDWRKLAFSRYEAEYLITLRNHKKEDVVVKIVEPIPGDWKMIRSSHEYKKTDAFTAEYQIPVPKDKEVKLSYRVRMKF